MSQKTERKTEIRKYFLGIDGGGTKTAVSMLDNEGRLVYSNAFGPSNLLNGKEFEEAVTAILKAVIPVIREQSRDKAAVDVFSGFAGISSDGVENRFRSAVKRSLLGHDIIIENLNMVSDALLALEVYFPSMPGLLLISGTGSICYGKDEKNKIFRTGGFGYLIDDHGSGFWFGKEAVRAALYSRFHNSEKTVLEELVFKHFSVSEPGELLDLIYKNNSKMILASASELVFKAQKEGCLISDRIISNGAGELAYLVQNCSELIGKKSTCVVLHGSVFRQELLVEKLKQKLTDQMNVYPSEKRIDLEAANLIYERSKDQKEP